MFHDEHRKSALQLECLRKNVEEVCKSGVSLDTELHEYLKTTLDDNSNKVSACTGSFQKIFWDQQQQAASVKTPKSMKWHPLMIKWCLYLRQLSGSSYELLKSNGCIKLPSQRTLRDYTYLSSTSIGFSDDVDVQLQETANVSKCFDYQKCDALLVDEVHIKSDLVFDKHSGEILGFINLGNTNNQLLEFEKSMMGEQESQLAKSMIMLMVRGLFTDLCFPYAQFSASISPTADLLFDPLWDAVARLEWCGLKLLCITADGASSNRRFFKMHDPSAAFVNKVLNLYSPDRFIYFFSDPPHLIKTARNCWSRNKLWCNGKDISWNHLKDLYLADNGISTAAPGLRLVPKLKYEQIDLTSFSKMRVDLAAEVLSETVANAIRATHGSEVEETVKFILNFDKFFDCLNVTNYNSGRKERKPFKDPYRSPDDLRLTWLQEFLKYLEQWNESVKCRVGFCEKQKQSMLLSPETRLGLKITVTSLIELIKYLFTLPGVKSFLSEKISQDPLEQFFGCQRQRGRSSDNPNVKEFCKNTQALRVVNSVRTNVTKGNCRGRKRASMTESHLEEQPLPKRRRIRNSI